MNEGDGSVVAQLISLGDERYSCNICESQRYVTVGRTRQCDIFIDDMYVSIYCFRIRCSKQFYEVEQLVENPQLALNGVQVKQGQTKELQHDDLLAMMVYSDSGDILRKPIIAFRFVSLSEELVLEGRPRLHRGCSGPRIVNLMKPSVCHRIDSDNLQVGIGCHPSFQVFEDGDALTNARLHLRLNHHLPSSCVLTQLSREGCYINEMFLAQNASHELQFGDIITFCKSPGRFWPKPAFVYCCDKVVQTNRAALDNLPTPSRSQHGALQHEDVDADALTLTVQDTQRYMPSVPESLGDEVVEVLESPEQASGSLPLEEVHSSTEDPGEPADFDDAETLTMSGAAKAVTRFSSDSTVASSSDLQERPQPAGWQRVLRRRVHNENASTVDLSTVVEESSIDWNLVPGGSHAMTLGESCCS